MKGDMKNELQEGSIVQITDEKDPWYPCILIVSEVKAWGVQAYVLSPQSNDGSAAPSQAYRRLKSELFEVVGHAEVIAQ